MYVFRNERNPELRVNAISYSREMLQKHPDLVIHVGCDSQNHRRKTQYAICVCYRYGTRGVHVIYHKWKEKKNRDMYTRLWKEAQLSIDLAMFLRDGGIEVDFIDFDFNEDDSYRSSQLVQGSVGMARGLGFEANVKPETLVACRAADHLCR